VPEPAVEVSDLVKRYGDTTAVAGASFAAARAAVTAVLGPNGAGKTTTVEICAGLRRADAGTVRVLGLDPARDGPRLRARVGVMPQTGGSGAAGVYPSARPAEVLRLFSAFYADPVPYGELLARLGLTDAAGTAWRRLSGGQQQRLSLALAVIGRPELVFLDEPTAGLDVQARHATWQLVDDLRAAGVSVVLTTHAMDEAERLADHVVIIDAGRVVATGSPAELTAIAGAPRRLTFAAAPRLPVEDLVAALPVGSSAAEDSPGHYVVEGEVDPALVAAVTAWCADNDVIPQGLSTEGRSLEDVFLGLTGKALRG
jgi:ABC-2 type transport system ATP-binding protein